MSQNRHSGVELMGISWMDGAVRGRMGVVDKGGIEYDILTVALTVIVTLMTATINHSDCVVKYKSPTISKVSSFNV